MKTVFSTALLMAAAVSFAAEITEKFDGALWSHWNSSDCKVQYKKNLTEGIKNTSCVELVLLPGNPNNKGSYFLKNYSLSPGKHYQTTVWVKNAAAGKSATAVFSMQARNAKGGYVSDLALMKRKISGEWIRLSCKFTVPKNILSGCILLGATGEPGSRVLFDDFSLKEIDPADPIMNHFDDPAALGFWKAAESKAYKIYEENDGKEAKGCFGIVIPKGNPKKCGAVLLTRIPVEKEKEYTFIIQAKATGFANDTKIGLEIQGQDSKTHFLGAPYYNTFIKAEDCRDWKRLALTLKVPSTGKWANCAYLLVTFGVRGDVPGKVLFDDFEYFVNKEE